MAKLRIKLKELMQERELTQMVFADMTGIPQSTISKWYGEKIDRLDKNIMEVFCEKLNCDISDLLVLERD